MFRKGTINRPLERIVRKNLQERPLYEALIRVVIEILKNIILNYKEIIRDGLNKNNKIQQTIENQLDIGQNDSEYDEMQKFIKIPINFTPIGEECNDPIDIFINDPNEFTVTNLIVYYRNQGLSKEQIINLINQLLDEYNNQILNDDCNGCVCYCGGGNCPDDSCIEYTCIDTPGCGYCASLTCIC